MSRYRDLGDVELDDQDRVNLSSVDHLTRRYRLAIDEATGELLLRPVVPVESPEREPRMHLPRLPRVPLRSRQPAAAATTGGSDVVSRWPSLA